MNRLLHFTEKSIVIEINVFQPDNSNLQRHTYRYTPLLAWMLLPNVTLTPMFGKLLFCGFDVIAGHLIYAHVRTMLSKMTSNRDYVETWAKRSAFLWLYNPMVMGVSSRGNAESIVVTLVLAMLLLYQVSCLLQFKFVHFTLGGH